MLEGVCGGCVWRLCVEGLCGGCVWRVCVEGVCGGCVLEGVCGGCVWRVCVEGVCGGWAGVALVHRVLLLVSDSEGQAAREHRRGPLCHVH